MMKSLTPRNRTAFDIVNIVAGLGLLFSPWYLGYAAETGAAWNAWIVGAAVVIVAGLIVAILAGISLWFTTNRPYSTA